MSFADFPFSMLRVLVVASLGVLVCLAGPNRHHPVKPRTILSPAEMALVEARRHILSAEPLAMFYYSDDSLGMSSLRAHADAMTLVAPQCFSIDAKGSLRGQLPAGLLDAKRRERIPLMPLVTNPSFDRVVAHKFLHSAQAQERAISALAQIAQSNQLVGWQFDFEGIDPGDKYAYTRFVSRAALRLHHAHRLVTVAVVPRFSDIFPDTSKTGYHTGEWGAAFDFRALGRVADFIVLMAYDQHTSLTPPGPVAAYDWVIAALTYATTRVPPSKLLLGVPLYGREWIETSGGITGHSLAYANLKTYIDDPLCDRYWDVLFRTTRFQLREGDVQRTAWFDDARSLREKLKLVQTYHLRGYAAWRLGMEDPEFWEREAQQSK